MTGLKEEETVKNSTQTHCPYSRNCLRDTLLMKRNGSLSAGGWFRELYDFSVRRARETVLRPQPSPYEAGRYLKKQRLKDSAPKVVIEVKDGAVVRVWSTNPYTAIDWFDETEDRVYAACARQDAAREHMVKIIDEEELL